MHTRNGCFYHGFSFVLTESYQHNPFLLLPTRLPLHPVTGISVLQSYRWTLALTGKKSIRGTDHIVANAPRVFLVVLLVPVNV